VEDILEFLCLISPSSCVAGKTNIRGNTHTEAVREQDAKDAIWAKEGECGRILEKTA
jgi:hypothetical protein